MGGSFRKEGTHVYLWLIRVMYDRNQHNIVKQKKKKKRNSCDIIFFSVRYFFQTIRGLVFIAKTSLQMVISEQPV